jgi:hypothetical protein
MGTVPAMNGPSDSDDFVGDEDEQAASIVAQSAAEATAGMGRRVTA